MTDTQALRAAILAAPLETSHSGEDPKAETLYVPPSHVKALRLSAHLVVGARGTGKSFWAAALQADALRGLLGSVAPELADVSVRLGFAGQENITGKPEKPRPSGRGGIERRA